MTQVLVDAAALNALCEEAAQDMRFRHLVAQVRSSVKSASPRSTSRRQRQAVEAVTEAQEEKAASE